MSGRSAAATAQEAPPGVSETISATTAKPHRRGRQRGDRAHSRRHWGRWLALGAAALGGLYWVGWHSQLTTVEQLQVTAPKGISDQAVREASRITSQSHVPAVDAGQVEFAVKTALPAVASVEVQRHLPHRVTLVVTAREPFAALAVKGGFMLLDAGGVPFDRVNRAKGLPVIAAQTEAGRNASLAVLSSLPPAVKSKVAVVRASTQDDVTLALKDTALVRWGSAADAQLKAKVLAALLPVKAKQYDVSAPMLPTTSGELEPAPATP